MIMRGSNVFGRRDMAVFIDGRAYPVDDGGFLGLSFMTTPSSRDGEQKVG
jgi:hypothetical protein